MISKVSIPRIFSVLFIILFTLATPALAAPGDTIRVSVASGGAQAAASLNGSHYPSISADGRYVAFTSQASNLVGGDTNDVEDVFLRDILSNTTTRVSVGSSNQATSSSSNPSISADGRYVAFMSQASNLVGGDTNGMLDVFVRDTQDGITTRVSIDSNGIESNKGSYYPSISADGRYVIFESFATNLVSGDTNGEIDVFLRDTQTNTTTCISVDPNGIPAGSDNYSLQYPSISANGRYVTFVSFDSNLVSGDTNLKRDIFVRDTLTNTTQRVSVGSNGVQGTGHALSYPSISADGRYVAFGSYADNLVNGDTNSADDIFMHDTITGITTRISINSNGVQSSGHSMHPSISADGRYISFESRASNLVNGDTNNTPDVFVRDTVTNTTMRASVDSSGVQMNNNMIILWASLSADGHHVAFQSEADNLVSGDTNGSTDVFMHEIRESTSTFADVPTSHPLHDYIEALYQAGYTAGCSTSPLMYCPDTILDRAQSAVFMLRGAKGSAYTPPPAPWDTFTDNWTGFEWAEPWAEGMWQEGLTAGCQPSPLMYCPATQLPRVEASVFGLRMKYGVNYTPPAGTGTVFADMTDTSYWGLGWAEQAYQSGLLPACSTDSVTGKPLFCPSELLDRGWGAYLIVKAKDIPLP